MIGIVIPAHNEEMVLGRALTALIACAGHPDLRGEAVTIIVVLDDCTDLSMAIARRFPVNCLSLSLRNVGAARAAGAALALDHGARWLAFTDADSVVSHDWLVAQLAEQADAVCGTVSVADWSEHGADAIGLQRYFEQRYQPRMGHRHIHGANFGVSAEAYRLAGGFSALSCHEDVALVQALDAAGVHICWSTRPRVTTSARINARARGGFGDTLLAYRAQVLADNLPDGSMSAAS